MKIVQPKTFYFFLTLNVIVVNKCILRLLFV